MGLLTAAAVGAGAAWAWDNFGKDIVGKLAGKIGEQAKKDWEQFRWLDAAGKYHARMKELYSEMRVLGKPDPVPVEGIFTDAYVLDRPTALRRFDIEELKKAYSEDRFFSGKTERLNAVELAKQKDRLFILGKPGAGKTTFLKYLTLQALDNQIEKIPIFVSLYEWANSGLKLMPFIARQFEICSFPEAKLFIDHILKTGLAMVLFDGLDEVKEESEQRSRLTTAINDFAKQYRKNKIFVTCRIAASNYAFDGFTDVEVADFNEQQVETFAHKWFRDEPEKGKRFIEELRKAEHRGLRELAQTPILLTLLCLAFGETLTFPPRRDEIYEEALNALLTKWDSSRLIRRDEVYKTLTPGRKRQLFSRLAAEYFERGDIFFRRDDLARNIEAFVAKLPASEGSPAPDGDVILKAIEAQHGIFVERAHGIYSFSHLTLQEYFTARYIVDNAAEGALATLVNNHLTDRRWREVFLLTASMLSDADTFFARFRREIDRLIGSDKQLTAFMNWANDKARNYSDVDHPAIERALALSIDDIYASPRGIALGIALGLDLDIDRARDLGHAFGFGLDLDDAFALAHARDLDIALAMALAVTLDRDFDVGLHSDHNIRIGDYLDFDEISDKARSNDLLDLCNELLKLKAPLSHADEVEWNAFAEHLREIMIRYRNIGHDWQLKEGQQRRLADYDYATILLAECLQLAAVSNRKEIEESLFLPPKVD